ncbi:putative receptor-like protein kinase At3g47110 [Corylus avellana]|uniref:putative receptor-like protein kinase At3g47110 n=1 Tax=Corylus avellana TaxID=13451 RepID=UPI00286BB0A5|nr:putative receptor-like protein kinase At3g47110 [Corylus avellana]
MVASSLQDRRLTCISYAELQASTNGFSGNNLIGSGSFGSVYKGVLSSNGAIVAIKVLNVQQRGASKSFIDECNALRSLSHLLLNENMVAHVGDFGLAKFVFEESDNPSKNQTMSNYLSVAQKGSIGYIPPEMCIGKKPTDDIFKDGLSIHKFTTMALPERVMDIVDSSMPFGEDGEDDETNNNDIEESAIIKKVDRHFNARSRVEDCLISVLQIGLLCSATSPHERLPTNEVVNKLRAIRDTCVFLVGFVEAGTRRAMEQTSGRRHSMALSSSGLKLYFFPGEMHIYTGISDAIGSPYLAVVNLKSVIYTPINRHYILKDGVVKLSEKCQGISTCQARPGLGTRAPVALLGLEYQALLRNGKGIKINLGNNNFYGEIPQEVGRLWHLQNLSLRYNSFGVNLPSNLSHCTQLRVLDVVYNKLIGQIPEQFSSLSNLVYLVLDVNNLTGSIPAWIGNISSLSTLSLALNNLQGSIPSELGRLLSLGFFQLGGNNLSGTITHLIYNISFIYYFVVAQNQLHRSLPPDVGLTLPNLETFFGSINSFIGPIPSSLSNASRLWQLDFSQNGLTGSMSQNLARLSGLVRLNFNHNRLGNGKVGDLNFLDYLANCTSLEILGLSHNQFGGVLPNSIANLSSQLSWLCIRQNMIHGGIPIGIWNLVNLTNMELEYNYLSGHLPDTVGKLSKLQLLYLNNSQFSGPIPSTLGNLTKLIKLFMENNRFGGSIPTSLGNCQDLLQLHLYSNNLNGTIPKQVIGLSSLAISLVMSNNSLTGTLPFEVGNLKMIGELDLSENRLSGEIPSSLGNCISLVRLHLEGNSFEGVIPPSLKTLRGLEEIDPSSNNLSGQIPEFLSKFLSLKHLNLSHNDFEGNVPSEGIFSNASAISIFGNEKLCGGVPELLLPKCFKKRTCSSLKCLALKVVIPVIFVLALLCFTLTCCMVKKWRKRPMVASSLQDRRLTCISYAELQASTNGFSGNNLIGSGSFGSVYKGVLSSNGAIVAIKVLNVQQRGASKSFIDECNALRSLSHRNLLKIITACSSIDHQGNEFKSLVF